LFTSAIINPYLHKDYLLLQGLLSKDCIPLTMGGDHLISYPILRAVASKHGPVALIHVDAHSDTAEHQETMLKNFFCP
jgi:arginase family enzyme